jgi:uncharacterized protein YndB with AHSA1/START domain
MDSKNFTLTLSFEKSPEEVYAAVVDVRGWWAEGLQGPSAAAGDEFRYRHGPIHYSVHRVTEAVPNQLVVWRTLDAELSRMKDKKEWVGTEQRFEIERKGDRTELRFTHVGLVPELDCFEACSRGWSYFVGDSLKQLIATGKGKPDAKAIATQAA